MYFSAFRLALLTLTATSLMSNASAALTKMVVGPLNATAYNQLLDCIRNVTDGDKYHIAVNEGQIVIMPPPGETIEDGNPVIRCLHIHSRNLHLSCAYDRWDVDQEGAPSQPLPQATAEWAESNGAQGKYPSDLPPTVPPTQRNTTRGENTLEPSIDVSKSVFARDRPFTFWRFGSRESRVCDNHDWGIDVFDTCHSHSFAYRSALFQNHDAFWPIEVKYWPHHRCAVDYQNQGMRRVTLAPSEESPCLNRLNAIFSYFGTVLSFELACDYAGFAHFAFMVLLVPVAAVREKGKGGFKFSSF